MWSTFQEGYSPQTWRGCIPPFLVALRQKALKQEAVCCSVGRRHHQLGHGGLPAAGAQPGSLRDDGAAICPRVVDSPALKLASNILCPEVVSLSDVVDNCHSDLGRGRCQHACGRIPTEAGSCQAEVLTICKSSNVLFNCFNCCLWRPCASLCQPDGINDHQCK